MVDFSMKNYRNPLLLARHLSSLIGDPVIRANCLLDISDAYARTDPSQLKNIFKDAWEAATDSNDMECIGLVSACAKSYGISGYAPKRRAQKKKTVGPGEDEFTVEEAAAERVLQRRILPMLRKRDAKGVVKILSAAAKARIPRKLCASTYLYMDALIRRDRIFAGKITHALKPFKEDYPALLDGLVICHFKHREWRSALKYLKMMSAVDEALWSVASALLKLGLKCTPPEFSVVLRWLERELQVPIR